MSSEHDASSGREMTGVAFFVRLNKLANGQDQTPIPFPRIGSDLLIIAARPNEWRHVAMGGLAVLGNVKMPEDSRLLYGDIVFRPVGKAAQAEFRPEGFGDIPIPE